MYKIINIGTRKSTLAQIQTAIVVKELSKKLPQYKFCVKTYSTQGDEMKDISLVKLGGKGLFIKSLEEKLLTGEIDIAIHSMKDVPARMMSNFSISSIYIRDSVEDCFLSLKTRKIIDLNLNSIIGTCSPRRKAQLLHHFNLKAEDLRGNIETRLSKINNFNGIILAQAALNRMHSNIDQKYYTERIDKNIFIPSGGQGAIGLQILKKNLSLHKKLQVINHRQSFECVYLERIFLYELNADCHVPVGVLVEKSDDKFHVMFEIYNQKNQRVSAKNIGDFFTIKIWLKNCGKELRNYINS